MNRKSSLSEDRKVAYRGYFHMKGERERERERDLLFLLGLFLLNPNFWVGRELLNLKVKGYH